MQNESLMNKIILSSISFVDLAFIIRNAPDCFTFPLWYVITMPFRNTQYIKHHVRFKICLFEKPPVWIEI